jgi:hypothetical protein
MTYTSDKDAEVRQTLERINKMRSAVDSQLFKPELEETHQLKINIDNTLPHGRFFESNVYPGQWRATSQTYKAMKKNIFALGDSDSLDEISEPYQCFGCKTDLDKQFWHFCPFCGERFRSEL